MIIRFSFSFLWKYVTFILQVFKCPTGKNTMYFLRQQKLAQTGQQHNLDRNRRYCISLLCICRNGILMVPYRQYSMLDDIQ